MNPLQRWLERRRLDRDLSREMAAHLEEHADALMDEGRTVDEARYEARRSFGNATRHMENSREAWGWLWAEQLRNDLQYGIRVLARSPGVTLTGIAILAMGIGMNTAMWSVVKAVLLSALPYPEPDRLVQIWQTNRAAGFMNVSEPDFNDWRQQNHSLEYMATYDADQASLSGSFAPRRIRMAVVSAGFFETLATEPLIGRSFGAAERKSGGAATIILGYALSQALFGSGTASQGMPPHGKIVRLDGLEFNVIGIMPPRFDYPDKAQAWIPQEFFGANTARSAHNFHAVGRLKRDTGLRQAQADMNVIAARLGSAYADDKDEGIRLVPLYDEIVGAVRPALFILLSAVTVVLLIACVNISNLQLARSTARLQEFSVRSALGAGRRRLVRQLLTESVLLATAGGVAGFFVAVAATLILRRTAPSEIPRLDAIHVDTAMLLFTTSLSIGAGLLSGTLPALFGSRSNPNSDIKGGSRTTGGPQLRSWGNTLAVGQIALAVVLLTAAALLIKSYWKLSHVDTGLKTGEVFTADISWPTADGNTVASPRIGRLTAALLSRVRALPGISATAVTQTLPIRSSGSNGDFEIEGRPLPPDPHQHPGAYYRLVSDGYFRTFQVPVLHGRDLDPHDAQSSEQVAIVNASFADAFFRKTDVLGHRIRFRGFDRKPEFMTIVGVVPDVRALGLKRAAEPEVFADYLQHPDIPMDATLLIRGALGQERAIAAILKEINPTSPTEFQSMADVIDGTVTRERFETSLLSLFGGFACLLATVGIYSLLSYTVTRRTREFGIRMALGATRRTVLLAVLREGTMLASLGIMLGLLCASALTRTLTALLYGTTANDLSAYVAVALLFAATATLACYEPAHRASRVNPNIALRYE